MTHESINGGPGSKSRVTWRTAMEMLAIVSADAAPSIASAFEPDPIFELIEKHKKANAEFYDALEIVPGTVSPGPEKERLYGDRELDARWELSTTTPKTIEGLLAVLSYVAGMLEGENTPSGKPDECFDIDEYANILIGAQACVRAYLHPQS